MCDSLWPLLDIEADSDGELKEKYRRIYLDTYVSDENGNKRVFRDWDNKTYQFGAHAFDHAFTESNNYRTSSGIHDAGFSKKRASRMLWIKEVLELSAGTVQRYAQTRKTDRGRQAKRRTLVVIEERYVIVFNDPCSKDEPYQFVSAFPADKSYLDKIKQDSFLVETKKAKIE